MTVGNRRGVGLGVLVQIPSCSMLTPSTHSNTLTGKAAPTLKMGTSAVIGENFDYFWSNPAILVWVMCDTRLLQVPSTSTSRLVRYFYFFPQLFSLQASFPALVFPHVQQPQPNWFVTLQTGPSTELVQANSCQRPSIPSCAPTWSTPSPSWTMATRSPSRTRPARLGCTHHSWSWRTGETHHSFGGSAEQFTVTGPPVLHTHTHMDTHTTQSNFTCTFWFAGIENFCLVTYHPLSSTETIFIVKGSI